MKPISIKTHDLITAIVIRASDEFLTFFLKGGIVSLYEDLQLCHRRLDLKRLLAFGHSDFSHDLTIINQYCRLNMGTFNPYCLKKATGPVSPSVTGRVQSY